MTKLLCINQAFFFLQIKCASIIMWVPLDQEVYLQINIFKVEAHGNIL